MTGKVDRRLLMVLASLAASVALKYMFFAGDGAPKVVAATTSIPLAEKRLQRLREQAATLPAKEALLKQVNAELATREKGIIQAETAPQAQAHLLDTIHRIAAQNGFDARGADQFTEAKPLGDAYGPRGRRPPSAGDRSAGAPPASHPAAAGGHAFALRGRGSEGSLS